MGESHVWDGSWSARKWVQDNIPGAVAQFSEWDWTLALRTDRGERYVPYGWVITRDDGGVVSIAPGEDNA